MVHNEMFTESKFVITSPALIDKANTDELFMIIITLAAKSKNHPLMGSECDYASYPSAKSEPQLISCAQADDNRAINLQATIDGVNLKQLDTYRATSLLVLLLFLPLAKAVVSHLELCSEYPCQTC